MAYDEGLAQLLRDDLADRETAERKMFGGLCIMHRGHMLCGVHKGGGMFRVGKPGMAAALAVPGAGPMTFTGRPMGGMVECSPEALEDDDTRGRLLALALAFAGTLPPRD